MVKQQNNGLYQVVHDHISTYFQISQNIHIYLKIFRLLAKQQNTCLYQVVYIYI